jgi:archaellum component FlaD/FlaE
MGRLADGDVDPAPSEPTATVIGNEKQADDPFPSEVESDESPAEAASVEGIDQLLESDDWAVDIDDIDLDEDIDDVVDADEREAVDPFEDSPDPEPDPDSKELATDPAHLAESTSPAQAVRTYVEEGNPEPTSVEPESAEGAFEFGKILMPDEDGGPELPELVGTDVEKPYLESLPSGYAINSLAIEWMGWLVNEGDPASAVDLVLSYEEADWLGETATDDLLAYLEGLVDVTGDLSGGTPEAYDLETHLHGLEYIKEIADDPSLTEVGTDGV